MMNVKLNLRMSCALAAAIAGCLALPEGSSGQAPVSASPLVIGDSYTIESEALGETRRINVYAPAGYAESDARLTVLYMPDGGIYEDILHVAGLVQISSLNWTPRLPSGAGWRRTDLLSCSTLCFSIRF